MKNVTETPSHFVLELRDPFWGAWKKYGWDKGVEGIGINEKLVEMACEKYKRILVKYKYGKYEITGSKAKKYAEKYKSYFRARDNTILLVIPRTIFYRIPDEIKKETVEPIKTEIKEQLSIS